VIYLGACRNVSPPDCVPCGGCTACTAAYVLDIGIGTYTNVQNLTSVTSEDWHSALDFGPTCSGDWGMAEISGVSITLTMPEGLTPQKLCGAWDFYLEDEQTPCGDGIDLSGLSVVVDGQDVIITATMIRLMCDSAGSPAATSAMTLALDAVSDVYGQVVLRIVVYFVDDTASDNALLSLWVCE
jgi:hypothetical protein